MTEALSTMQESPTEWICVLCTFANRASNRKCDICQAVHTGSERQHAASMSKALKLQAEAMTASPVKKQIRPRTSAKPSHRKLTETSRNRHDRKKLMHWRTKRGAMNGRNTVTTARNRLESPSFDNSEFDGIKSEPMDLPTEPSSKSPELFANLRWSEDESSELATSSKEVASNESLSKTTDNSDVVLRGKNSHSPSDYASGYESVFEMAAHQYRIRNSQTNLESCAVKPRKRARRNNLLTDPSILRKSRSKRRSNGESHENRGSVICYAPLSRATDGEASVIKNEEPLDKFSYDHSPTESNTVSDRTHSPEFAVKPSIDIGERRHKEHSIRAKAPSSSVETVYDTWISVKPFLATNRVVNGDALRLGMSSRPNSIGDDSISFADSASTVSDHREALLDFETPPANPTKRVGFKSAPGLRSTFSHFEAGSSRSDCTLYDFDEYDDVAMSTGSQLSRLQKGANAHRRGPAARSMKPSTAPSLPSKPKFYVHRPLQPTCDPKPISVKRFTIPHEGIEHTFEEMILSDSYSSGDDEA